MNHCKQIFIPKPVNNLIDIALKADRTDVNFPNTLELTNLVVIGIVNQKLNNEANCRQIVKVEAQESFGGEDHEDFDKLTFAEKVARRGYPKHIGYLVTYLESEMVASRDDLERAWDAGEKESKEDEQAGGSSYSNLRIGQWFEQWFQQNFE